MVQTCNQGDSVRYWRWHAGGTAHTSWEVGENSKAQVEHAGTRESRLVRQREGEEGGIINRKLSIPQHLRDRGIAVIRPRGRKLAGLWERKPRLEEGAEESETEDCYCIQASVGQRERGKEREKEKHTWRIKGEGRGARGM